MTDTKTVPCEPTEAMWEAARQAWRNHERPYTFDCTKAAFRAMLAAAPAHQPDRQGAGKAEPFMYAYECVDDGRWQAYRHQLKRADGSICPGKPLYAAPPPPADTAMRGLKADFVRSHPSGFDDSTYEKIEDALDRLDAPMCDATGKWLTLVERIATLSRRDAAEEQLPSNDDDADSCIACAEPFLADDQVFNDVGGGTIHARCCGPERESYVGADGEPLKDGEPLPTPWRYGDIIPTAAQS